MVTPEEVRRLALSMPETEEKSHFGQPDFRAKGKIFAGLSVDEKRGSLKLLPEVQALVVASKPKAFIPAEGAWGVRGWTYVILAEVALGEYEELMRESFRLTAPKRVVALLDGDAPKPTRPRPAERKPAAKKIVRSR